MSHIKGENRNQASAFPFTLEEWVTEDNPVRVIDLFVEGLDLDKLNFIAIGKSSEGRPAYDSKLLLKVYLYGYLNRIRSSRLLERECERNTEMMWLTGNLRPCFRTIAGFRSDNKSALNALFKLFVQMMRSWNLVSAQTVAIDSSKFRAVNSKKNNFNAAKIERQLEYIDKRIENYLREMENADASDDHEFADMLNAGIITQLNRKLKYHDLKKQLDHGDEDQISLTDPDARSMILHGQVVEVAFNIQTVVDDKHNLIVNYKATNKNDRKALASIAIETKELLQVDELITLADKGYNNAQQIQACTDNGIVTYVAVPDTARNTEVPTPDYYGENFIYDPVNDNYQCPQGNTLITNGNWYTKTRTKYSNQVMHYKTPACKSCPVKHLCTKSKDGRLIERSEYAHAVAANNKRIKSQPHIYIKRQQIIEHVFGTIKRQWGMDHILLKGLSKNNGEFGLIYLSYNFKRVLNILGVNELKKRLKMLFLSLKKIQRTIKDVRYSINIFIAPSSSAFPM